MEKVLEEVKKVVTGYRPGQGGSHLKTARALLSGVAACRIYIKENAQTDRGCAQRIVRELDDLLNGLPSFHGYTSDAKAVHRLHTRKMAEEYLDLIEKYLDGIIKEEQEGKVRLIQEWVNLHPVFNELKQTAAKRLPKSAYILLFRQNKDESLELVTESAPDGRIFTRFRPHEFLIDAKVHKNFHHQPSIVGAAIIAEKELLSVIGQVPPAGQNMDQLRVLLAFSSEAAGRPAKQFIELNAVLKELHQLCHRHKLPKDAYVLLFQTGQGSPDIPEPYPEIVVRTGSDGKIISRFWGPDFAVKHKLFDEFAGKPAVVGAAIIKHAELLQVIGQVRQPVQGQTQVEVLLEQSRSAVEKPLLEFLQANEVLKGLYEMANGELAVRDAQVILFEQVDGGKLQVMPLTDSAGRRQSRIPLSEFQLPKVVHDRFAGKAIAGASVIAEVAPLARSRPAPVAAAKGKPESTGRHAPATGDKPVVLAAFGRTPLKVNLLATTEILQRLGITLW